MTHNWQTRLAEFINQNRKRPFEWGSFDCCLFAADAAQIVTGQDYAAPFRGRYSTKIGAGRALQRYGAGTLAETITQQVGQPRQGIGYQRGDICLVETDQGDAAGIFFGGYVWTTGPDGLTALPPTEIKQFWSISACHQ